MPAKALEKISAAFEEDTGLIFQQIWRRVDGHETPVINPVLCTTLVIDDNWLTWGIPYGDRPHFFEIDHIEDFGNAWILVGIPDSPGASIPAMRVSRVEKEHRKEIDAWLKDPDHIAEIEAIEAAADVLADSEPVETKAAKKEVYEFSEVYHADNDDLWAFVGCIARKGSEIRFIVNPSVPNPVEVENQYVGMIAAAQRESQSAASTYLYLVEEYANGATVSISEPESIRASGDGEILAAALLRSNRRQRR